MTTVQIEKGSYNHIHESVQFIPLCDNPGSVVIGDCNTIHENVKIVVGEEGFQMGDWNTIHNGVFIMDKVKIGHNCWIGQGSHLDGRGKLRIGNGVSICYFGHIWTHVARGCLFDGCTLWGKGEVILEDDVWMVGNNVHISPNVTVARRSIILAHSVITKDTRPETTYGGNPAKKLPKMGFWEYPTDQVKFEMMQHWLEEFVESFSRPLELTNAGIVLVLKDPHYGESLYFAFHTPDVNWGKKTTFFHLGEKTYTKRLTLIEREFYKFIKDYKARFLPV